VSGSGGEAAQARVARLGSRHPAAGRVGAFGATPEASPAPAIPRRPWVTRCPADPHCAHICIAGDRDAQDGPSPCLSRSLLASGWVSELGTTKPTCLLVLHCLRRAAPSLA